MIDRKEQILEAASDLLTTRSYSSFSYQDLSDRLGIRKASIHHHFPTKEALGVALTGRFLETYRSALEEIDRTHEGPWERLEAYLTNAERIRNAGAICSIGILQAEHNVVPETINDGQCKLAALIHSWLTGVLGEGRARGAMEFPGTPEDQALFLLAAIQGGLQNARSAGPELFAIIVSQIGKSLKPKRRS